MNTLVKTSLQAFLVLTLWSNNLISMQNSVSNMVSIQTNDNKTINFNRSFATQSHTLHNLFEDADNTNSQASIPLDQSKKTLKLIKKTMNFIKIKIDTNDQKTLEQLIKESIKTRLENTRSLNLQSLITMLNTASYFDHQLIIRSSANLLLEYLLNNDLEQTELICASPQELCSYCLNNGLTEDILPFLEKSFNNVLDSFFETLPTSSLQTSSPIHTTQTEITVPFVTYDGGIVYIEKSLIDLSATLKNILNDAEALTSHELITLNNVSNQTLSYFIPLLEIQKKALETQTFYAKKFENDIHSNLNALPFEILIDLTNCANYLDCPEILSPLQSMIPDFIVKQLDEKNIIDCIQQIESMPPEISLSLLTTLKSKLNFEPYLMPTIHIDLQNEFNKTISEKEASKTTTKTNFMGEKIIFGNGLLEVRITDKFSSTIPNGWSTRTYDYKAASIDYILNSSNFATNCENMIDIWDYSTGRHIRTLSADELVQLISYSNDGKFLTAHGIGFIQLWNIESGQELGCVKCPILNLISLVPIPSKNCVVGQSIDGKIFSWYFNFNNIAENDLMNALDAFTTEEIFLLTLIKKQLPLVTTLDAHSSLHTAYTELPSIIQQALAPFVTISHKKAKTKAQKES